MNAINKFFLAALVAAPSIFSLACGPNPPISGTAGSGGQGGTGSGGKGGTAGTAGSTSNPYCDVQPIIDKKCTGCHSNPPNSGAPFSLDAYADVVAHRDRMIARIDAGTMPPSYATQLTADEKTRVLAYLRAGAQGAECGGGTAPDFNNDPLPCNVNRQFKAHAPGSAGKFQVAANTRNAYACFVFRNPMAANEIITASRPHPDSSNVHHFILFGIPENGCGLFGNAPCTDGAVTPTGCVWPQLRGRQLEGWAPGGNRTIFPSDIGTKVDSPWLALQVHYNSPNGGTDASGIEYCTEPHNPATRPNIAEVVTLGTDNINIPAGAQNHLVENTCAGLPVGSSPVYVIGTSPHMHELGTAFRTEVVKNGKLLSDVPDWDFNEQYHYPITERYQLQPGDALRTRCWYSNPTSRAVSFGPNTEQEMCYDFMMVYPAAQTRNECGSGVTFQNNN